jgi:hypothetical protein
VRNIPYSAAEFRLLGITIKLRKKKEKKNNTKQGLIEKNNNYQGLIFYGDRILKYISFPKIQKFEIIRKKVENLDFIIQ